MRTIYKYLTIFCLLCLISLGVIYAYRERLASMYLSYRLKVDTSIEKITLSPWQVSIEQIEIKNPPGSQIPVAFSCPSVEISYSISRLFNNPRQIDQVILKQPTIAIEFYSDGSYNWGRMIDQLKEEGRSEEGEKKGFNLGYVRFEKAVVKNYKPGKDAQVSTSKETDLELRDISSDLSGPKLAAFILQNVVLNLGKASHVDDLIKKAKDYSKDLFDNFIDNLKKSPSSDEDDGS